jgi:hypothetical protein
MCLNKGEIRVRVATPSICGSIRVAALTSQAHRLKGDPIYDSDIAIAWHDMLSLSLFSFPKDEFANLSAFFLKASKFY